MLANLNKQWVLLCYALSFFSRLPVPRSTDFKAYPFHLGNVYFPIVGGFSAIIGFSVYYVAQSVFDHSISVILMLIASLLFTGALHEDGFADSCDGFGGGYNKKQCLAIMKDSQIGTYGVLGLILLFALKVSLLTNLSMQSNAIFFGVLLTAGMVSRLSILVVIQSSQYARDDASSKAASSSSALPKHYLLLAVFMSLGSLYWMPVLWSMLILLILMLSTLLCRAYFNKQIQGYTGDCLGFLQQVNELLVFLILLPLFETNLVTLPLI